MTETRKAVRWREVAALVTILLAAAALRTWRLGNVPPGLTHDEAAHGHDAVAILEGARPLYETVGYGREPLYDYWVAGLMALLGRTREVLRVSAVPLGLMALVATFAWTRLAYDAAVALASTALQAVSFWSLSISRQALRSSLLLGLFTTAVFFFWRAIDGEEEGASRWRLGVFALLTGATFYTYIPARVLWIVFPCFLVYLAFLHRSRFRRVSGPAVAAVGVGVLLAVPLFLYLRSHPGADRRLAMLDAPLRALMDGNPAVILNRATRFLLGLIVPGQGDDFLAYNVPGRPVLGPLVGGLFLVGLGISLARWRERAFAFSLIWFIVGVSPSLVTGAGASTTRSIAALPVVFLFPALAAVVGARWAGRHWGHSGVRLIALVSCGALFLTGVSSTRDYFVKWAESPHTRAAYQHTLVETAAYLDAQSAGGTVGISTVQPYAPHDPYVFGLSLRRDDLALRWFDAGRALVLPAEPRARLVVPASAAPHRSLAELPGLRLQERIRMHPDDLDPWFEIYDWRPRQMRASLLERVERGPLSLSLEDALSGDPAEEGVTARSVTYGQGLDLLGYELLTPTASAGNVIELLTLWQVTNPDVLQDADPVDVDSEPVVFVHALDRAGMLVSQEDRLDAPAWAWREGDAVVQVHRLVLPSNLPDAELVLALGIYRRSDMRRLPVLLGGKVVGDQVFLSPVEIVE